MKKKNGNGVYFFWSAAMIVTVLTAVFAIIFASCSGGTAVRNSTAEGTDDEVPAVNMGNVDADNQEEEPPVSSAPPPPVELAETEDMGQEYLDKIVFLGDSTTNGLASYGLIPEGRVWTPQNGTLSIFRWDVDQISLRDDGVTMFMDEALALKKPEYLLVTLGVNGVSLLGEEDFTSFYSSMVDALMAASPDTKIILNSIYPVGASYGDNSINNEKINAANGWIRNIAQEKGLRYLNSASAITDANGYLPEGYDNGDGLHPNPETYGMILDYIRTHGYV